MNPQETQKFINSTSFWSNVIIGLGVGLIVFSCAVRMMMMVNPGKVMSAIPHYSNAKISYLTLNQQLKQLRQAIATTEESRLLGIIETQSEEEYFNTKAETEYLINLGVFFSVLFGFIIIIFARINLKIIKITGPS